MAHIYLRTKYHTEPCKACGGDGGRVHPTGWENCFVCDGTKRIQQIDVSRYKDCNGCDGSGEMQDESLCSTCEGEGYIPFDLAGAREGHRHL